jgi:ubiquinone/menaquinone biosynthesis C-methylase UbiE
MRVLDLGCGKAVSSIFFAREFHASVWAIDPKVLPHGNFRRIAAAGCRGKVFPLSADARDLPFRERFFDVAVAIDSIHYFGTGESFLPGLRRHLKPGGYIGVVDVGFSSEIERPGDIPDFLRTSFERHWWFVHSVGWWKAAWEKSGGIEVLRAEVLPESQQILHEYVLESTAAGAEDEICRAVRQDADERIVLFRLVARVGSSPADNFR